MNTDKYTKLLHTNQNKILCLAKNYIKHIIEMGGKDIPPYPLVFTKPWTSFVFEPNPIKIKTFENHRIDHESKNKNKKFIKKLNINY
jgi:2-keto-4-pentenoate hydratase/2-oxohepta-3-ene-1,7-dioic acid hydratase in catechol pathway